MIRPTITIGKRLYVAFFWAWNGLKYAYRTQWAFRFELLLVIMSFPAAYFIATTVTEFIIMMSAIFLLPILELLNTAVETTVNRISFEYHELSGLAKDLGSSTLFCTGGLATFIWGIYIIRRLVNWYFV